MNSFDDLPVYNDHLDTGHLPIVADQFEVDQAVALQPLESQIERQLVLVLEDEPDQQTLILDHLAVLGLPAVGARTISEARQKLNELPIQLAIFDVTLPDGSGLQLCEELSDDPRFAGLPVIVLSSLTRSDMVRQTRSAGGSFFLSKPYDPNVLLAIIERALDDSLE